MLEPPSLGLDIVGPDDLGDAHRECLRPGQILTGPDGISHELPRFFYEVPSWEAAMDIRLAPHFGLWELIEVDLREAEPQRGFPRYVPCAVASLAAQLEVLRVEVGRVVRIAANGGYRSPSHLSTRGASTHCWASAANVYRIGDDWLDSRDRIRKYAEIARRVLPHAWIRQFGDRPGMAFDHLHLDFGYVSLEPHPRPAAPENETIDSKKDEK